MANRATYTLREIAERFGGEVLGDPDVRVSGIATLDAAGPDALAFLTNDRYRSQLDTTQAAAVIVGPSATDATTRPRIVSTNPQALYARASALFNPPRACLPGIHPAAVVDPAAVIDAGAEIGACAVIGAGVHIGSGTIVGAGTQIGAGSQVGNEVRLHARVTVAHDCVLGDRVEIHSGAVIGSDGFGLAFDSGRWIKVPQIGRVVIGSDVEVGANTTIDRGALGDTVIEDGVKLDNLIQVAHNVHIGAHTAIAACTGIAGSTRIGRYCRIGGGVGIAGHLRIADNVEISAGTGVSKSIESAGTYSGLYPFGTNREWRRNAVQLRHLAELALRVAELEAKINEASGSPS